MNYGFAINDFGEIAGYAYSGNGDLHATRWIGASETYLNSLGGTLSGANGINDAGQVVGWSNTPGIGFNHATIWNGSIPTDLDTPDGMHSRATGINNAGQVVGYASQPNSVSNATIWNGTVRTVLSETSSQAQAINDSGQIVGFSYGRHGNFYSYRATFWEASTQIELDALGSLNSDSQANALNNSGQVVGWSYDFNMNQRATLWNGTSVTDINSFLDADSVDAGWVLREATGINDRGWIVGNSYNTKFGWESAFLMKVTDVPEPGSVTIILTGFAVLMCTRRRKAV